MGKDALAAIDRFANQSVKQHADAIRARRLRMASDTIEIGVRLLLVKEKLPHGEFIPWVEQEFSWDKRTAQRLLAVGSAFGKNDNLSLLKIDASALYELAKGGVSDDIRGEALARAEAGEHITHAIAKELVGSIAGDDGEPLSLSDLVERLRRTITRISGDWGEQNKPTLVSLLRCLAKEIEEGRIFLEA